MTQCRYLFNIGAKLKQVDVIKSYHKLQPPPINLLAFASYIAHDLRAPPGRSHPSTWSGRSKNRKPSYIYSRCAPICPEVS